MEGYRFMMNSSYNHSTLDNLRKTHMNSIEVLESEIDKLRALLEIKNAEIETLIQ